MSFIFCAGSDTVSFLFAHLSFLSSFCFLFRGKISSVIFYVQCAPCKVGKNLINQVLKHIAQGRKKPNPLPPGRNHQVSKVLGRKNEYCKESIQKNATVFLSVHLMPVICLACKCLCQQHLFAVCQLLPFVIPFLQLLQTSVSAGTQAPGFPWSNSPRYVKYAVNLIYFVQIHLCMFLYL